MGGVSVTRRPRPKRRHTYAVLLGPASMRPKHNCGRRCPALWPGLPNRLFPTPINPLLPIDVWRISRSRNRAQRLNRTNVGRPNRAAHRENCDRHRVPFSLEVLLIQEAPRSSLLFMQHSLRKRHRIPAFRQPAIGPDRDDHYVPYIRPCLPCGYVGPIAGRLNGLVRFGEGEPLCEPANCMARTEPCPPRITKPH